VAGATPGASRDELHGVAVEHDVIAPDPLALEPG
jgi:hypothetical protein